jgi:MoaA/NifB/PqqE/SkfB family radical SAM enzyme
VINASIELLSKCNQNCRHCYWEELTKKGLELRYLLSLAKELKEIGVIFILLTGGETFLRPDILEILSCLNELGFAIEIKTNGSLLNQKIIDFLPKIKIYDLQVSIYEIKDGYSAFTRSNYNFSRISENVNLLLSLGIRTSLSVTVGNHNINEIERWHEKLISLFGEEMNISYSPYITPNRGGKEEGIKLRLSREDLNGKFYQKLLGSRHCLLRRKRPDSN